MHCKIFCEPSGKYPILNLAVIEGDNKSYMRKVENLIMHVKREFPLLSLNHSIEKKQRISTIRGWLIKKELCKFCYDEKDYKKEGIYIEVPLIESFRSEGSFVIDLYQMINWNAVPDEFKHRYYDDIFSVLCTHHRVELALVRNKIMRILLSASALINEYKRYEVSGMFQLNCLPHSDDLAIERINERLGEYGEKWYRGT